MPHREQDRGPGRWPFAEPRELPVVSLKSIVRGGKPVLLVRREYHDGLWQFLGAGRPAREDGLLVSLAAILDRDPSLLELSDLEPGWMAWRTHREDPWQRRPIRASASH